GQSDAEAYFRRSGALLCVVYLLHGTDCHAENVVDAGSHPVLVDVETVLTPHPRQDRGGPEARRLARARLQRSVISTYLLPVWSRSIYDGLVHDGSGFGMDTADESVLNGPRWVSVNTDHMRVSRGPAVGPLQPRAALADGTPLLVYEYEAPLVAGFAAMYRFLIRTRGALLAA